MRYVAVAERRLVPGRTGDYMHAFQQASAILARSESRSASWVVVSDDDESHVLIVAEWTDPRELERAYAGLPESVAYALDSAVAERVPPAPWRVYDTQRRVERVLERAWFVTAVRVRVAEEDLDTYLPWATDVLDEAMKDPQIIAIGLHRAEDDPTRFLCLIRRRTRPVVPTGSQFLRQHPSPVRFLEYQSFRGRIDLQWDREAAPRSSISPA